MRIAVLGLFNSGSTALAGALHHLGVHMGGPPFFQDKYEPADVSIQLRKWWNEPQLVESVNANDRVRWLADWIRQKEDAGFTDIGIKHPLLCLSAPDVEQAWGNDVRYIWSKRSLEESIARLKRRNWYANATEMQQTLWTALESFTADHEHLAITYSDLAANSRDTIERLVQALSLSVSADQIDRAAATVRRPVTVVHGDYPRFY